jgi:Pyruvate/2-oxoacid:ferredoxin oxidoreductase delta subunit
MVSGNAGGLSVSAGARNPLEAERMRVVLDRSPSGDSAATDGGGRFELLDALLSGGVAVTSAGEGAVAPLDEASLLVLRPDAPGSAEPTSPTASGDDGPSVRELGIDGLEPEAVLAKVSEHGEGQRSGGWTPWFPVIDYDRCTNCMQCLSFCLFGVYDVDEEKRIDVAHPERCKTLCPACSRVCPEVAILFPKYKAGPINGDVVVDEDLAREKMKTDISSLLGGDIYSLLRQRSERAQSRFAKERDEDRALKERQRCLKKLQKDLDIPEEVLQQLPTADAIRAKAADRIAQQRSDDDSSDSTDRDSKD